MMDIEQEVKAKKQKCNLKLIEVDITIPEFLSGTNTKKYVEVKGGESLYIKDSGECFI
jgi:hypothetical protein